jgi:hypothetical protein
MEKGNFMINEQVYFTKTSASCNDNINFSFGSPFKHQSIYLNFIINTYSILLSDVDSPLS